MVNESFLFHFLFEEDRMAVEEKLLVYGKGFLVLSCWSVDFDPRKAKISKRHL